MVPPLGMDMAFNTTALHHQPHVRLSAPSAAFLSGYYPQAAAAAGRAARGAAPRAAVLAPRAAARPRSEPPRVGALVVEAALAAVAAPQHDGGAQRPRAAA